MVVHWEECLISRRRALGSRYYSWLGKSVLCNFLGFGGFTFGASFVFSAIGKYDLISAFNLETVLFAGLGGALLRFVLELLPRSIAANGEAVIIRHGNWSRVKVYKNTLIRSVKIIKGKNFSRVEIYRRGSTDPIITGIDVKNVENLNIWIENVLLSVDA